MATLPGTTYGFIGSERGDAVPVHDLADETAPALPTGEAPERLSGGRVAHRRPPAGIGAGPRAGCAQIAPACHEIVMYPIVLCAFESTAPGHGRTTP